MADDEDIVEGAQSAIQKAEDIDEVFVPEVQPVAPPKYEVRPLIGEKFQAQDVRDIILWAMQEQLTGRSYRADQVPRWCRMIANSIRTKVQMLNMKRYKIVVYTHLIEMKGAGVKCAQRCLWDPETDDWADNLYRNETIFCYTVCYGIYMY
ncbi:tctex-1 family domain-containing protein [Phthorimaea operculella]|nr:tctex-1 family domain-containing protein [Phthorimaea operculella]